MSAPAKALIAARDSQRHRGEFDNAIGFGAQEVGAAMAGQALQFRQDVVGEVALIPLRVCGHGAAAPGACDHAPRLVAHPRTVLVKIAAWHAATLAIRPDTGGTGI
jgi:hypothetical protein